MIRVHISDDHQMFVEGLTGSLTASGEITVTGYSNSLAKCEKELALGLPDVLLLDINFPDGSGIDFCRKMRKKYPQLKVLVLTTHDEYSVVKRVFDNGASGYILKASPSRDVIAGIKTVMAGELYCSAEIATMMKDQDEQMWITTRELQVLGLLVEGYKNNEIADKLRLSVETVKTYRKSLKFKIGARTSSDMVKIAIEQKLV